LQELYVFYGEDLGVRVARKHIGWYTKELDNATAFRAVVNQAETCSEQLALVDTFMSELAQRSERLVYKEELAAW
jgi:tRNA-dihydrouridine synthase B